MSISTESSSIIEPSSLRMPVIFLPHGGGPLPLLNDPNHTELIDFLSGLPASLPRPKAILMISAHWEEAVVSVSSSPTPTMIYDYSVFPPQSYTFQYPAAGDPALAASSWTRRFASSDWSSGTWGQRRVFRTRGKSICCHCLFVLVRLGLLHQWLKRFLAVFL